ncbi:prepilin-type N-terminal cleavage/methylation domain-containing protein [Massilia sp. CF038]|uniref:prepilin-type N-terminal cleavage/methylation domain-containing protein n=1 Tax=Massilia sp. CF038 TaxID=1881045 RepID=UPI00091C83A8|nr:prepilin-type N-terminal cleavage/methylation domain-containing protein [Massilia sp. CF038]SHG71601.1 prepilin-type N-terminal cleavage/methylation domain-containing protein [Massilia sp. CF038]
MKHNSFLSRKQSGFTLVEIAIVLVIIGLLLGGVLKGQEMIENARIKSVVGDMNGISAAYNSYFDRYHAIPGDETAATFTGRGWAGTAVGNGNGVLLITPAQTFTNGGEQAALWRSLRASGMTSGDPTAPATAVGLPRAGTGGLLGVTVGVYGMTGNAICVSGLTTKQASGVDTTIDGALPATNIGNNVGNARGATGVAPLAPTAAVPGPTAYNETTVLTPWTMCRTL